MMGRNQIATIALILTAAGAAGAQSEAETQPSSMPTAEPTSMPSSVGRPAAAQISDMPMEVRAEVTTEAPADVGAPPWSADLTMSGLMSRVIREGHGERHATPQDHVTVHYSGWTTDGEMFDSSVDRGIPASFPLSGLIEGWQEGIPLMVVGEIRRFWIPANLAYGNTGGGGRPTGMLVFDIELISINS